jgi:hypothetical protein
MRNPLMQDSETFLRVTLEITACDMVRQSRLRPAKFAVIATHFIDAIISEMQAAMYSPEAITATLESVKASIEAQLAKGGQS